MIKSYVSRGIYILNCFNLFLLIHLRPIRQKADRNFSKIIVADIYIPAWLTEAKMGLVSRDLRVLDFTCSEISIWKNHNVAQDQSRCRWCKMKQRTILLFSYVIYYTPASNKLAIKSRGGEFVSFRYFIANNNFMAIQIIFEGRAHTSIMVHQP